jgi:FtsZ-interacting cell division protein ZipA
MDTSTILIIVGSVLVVAMLIRQWFYCREDDTRRK